jgi:hypothetical protein
VQHAPYSLFYFQLLLLLLHTPEGLAAVTVIALEEKDVIMVSARVPLLKVHQIY